MNGYEVCLTITDCCCDKCCKKVFKNSLCVTSTSQAIKLQNCFTLNVISVSQTFVTILIQNGFFTIIRNVFTTFPTQILLPNKCSEHIVTIEVDSITQTTI